MLKVWCRSQEEKEKGSLTMVSFIAFPLMTTITQYTSNHLLSWQNRLLLNFSFRGTLNSITTDLKLWSIIRLEQSNNFNSSHLIQTINALYVPACNLNTYWLITSIQEQENCKSSNKASTNHYFPGETIQIRTGSHIFRQWSHSLKNKVKSFNWRNKGYYFQQK